MPDIHEGDDITVSGKVTWIYDKNTIVIQCNTEEEYFINIKDIKTHRPNWKGEENDERKT